MKDKNADDDTPTLNMQVEDVNMLSNVAFGQLISITDNMKQFGVDRTLIREIEVPFMEKYKIGQENREAIFSLI